MPDNSLRLKPFQSKFHLPRRARLEIVPLIDVMFLLVSFFVVVSISMVQQKGIQVDLAASDSAEEFKPEEEDLVLSLDARSVLAFSRYLIVLPEVSIIYSSNL